MPSRQLAWTEPSHENDVYTKPPEVPLPQRATGNAPVLSHHWHSSRCTLAVHSLLGNVVFSLYNQATRDRVPELVVPSVKDLSGPELRVRPVSLRLFIRHKETKERGRDWRLGGLGGGGGRGSGRQVRFEQEQKLRGWILEEADRNCT